VLEQECKLHNVQLWVVCHAFRRVGVTTPV
jgi:hypothetical protein